MAEVKAERITTRDNCGWLGSYFDMIADQTRIVTTVAQSLGADYA